MLIGRSLKTAATMRLRRKPCGLDASGVDRPIVSPKGLSSGQCCRGPLERNGL
jgi:hypothetical protein